jgi:hypothetical protein
MLKKRKVTKFLLEDVQFQLEQAKIRRLLNLPPRPIVCIPCGMELTVDEYGRKLRVACACGWSCAW